MIPTNVEVSFDNSWIQGYIENQLKDSIQSKIWLVDMEHISKLTNMSKRFLEDEIVNDPRMKVIELRKSRKRWWPAEKAFEVIIEITKEW